LILKNEIPTLLFREEIENEEFRQMALDFEKLSKGYSVINAKPAYRNKVNRFAGQLLEVLNEAYAAGRKEFKKDHIALEVLDLISEIARP
jgi:hypothetical protein